MIIWFSLAACLLFGGQSHASPDIPPEFRTSVTHDISTTASSTSLTTPQQTTIQSGYFQSNWDLTPEESVVLGENKTFNYSFDEEKLSVPNVVLCQTNATGAEPVLADNTWTVTLIESYYTFGMNRGYPADPL
jgi:hypothetical protein